MVLMSFRVRCEYSCISAPVVTAKKSEGVVEEFNGGEGWAMCVMAWLVGEEVFRGDLKLFQYAPSGVSEDGRDGSLTCCIGRISAAMAGLLLRHATFEYQ